MPQPNSHKVWFGASKGFGHVWTEAALARGDSVAAAARNIGPLYALKGKYGERLLPLALDVWGRVIAGSVTRGNRAALIQLALRRHPPSGQSSGRRCRNQYGPSISQTI
jgi:hypothetical protein